MHESGPGLSAGIPQHLVMLAAFNGQDRPATGHGELPTPAGMEGNLYRILPFLRRAALRVDVSRQRRGA